MLQGQEHRCILRQSLLIMTGHMLCTRVDNLGTRHAMSHYDVFRTSSWIQLMMPHVGHPQISLRFRARRLRASCQAFLMVAACCWSAMERLAAPAAWQMQPCVRHPDTWQCAYHPSGTCSRALLQVPAPRKPLCLCFANDGLHHVKITLAPLPRAAARLSSPAQSRGAGAGGVHVIGGPVAAAVVMLGRCTRARPECVRSLHTQAALAACRQVHPVVVAQHCQALVAQFDVVWSLPDALAPAARLFDTPAQRTAPCNVRRRECAWTSTCTGLSIRCHGSMHISPAAVVASKAI